jgi:hypothetical protein
LTSYTSLIPSTPRRPDPEVGGYIGVEKCGTSVRARSGGPNGDGANGPRSSSWPMRTGIGPDFGTCSSPASELEGEGVVSIHKRSTKARGTTWVVRYRDPLPRERTFHRKSDAQRFERLIRHQLDTGEYLDPELSKITFQEWHDRWLPTILNSDRAPSTITGYESSPPPLRPPAPCRLSPERAPTHRRRGVVDRPSVRRLLQLDHPCGTDRRRHGAHLGRGLEIIAANPLTGVRLPKGSSRTRKALTARTGRRPGGTGGPVVAPLRARSGLLRPTARRSRCPAPSTPRRSRSADHRRSDDRAPGPTRRAGHQDTPGPCGPGPGFGARGAARRISTLTSKTEPMHRSSRRRREIGYALELAAPGLAASLPSWATPYVLRHTAASLMAQSGVPVTAAAAALGHDPAVFLRTYAHLYPGDLKAVADAMVMARGAARGATNDDAGGGGSAVSRVDFAGMATTPPPRRPKGTL